MKKALIIVVVILVLAGVGYYFYRHNKAYAPSYDNYQPDQDQQATSSAEDAAPNGQTKTINSPTGTPDYTPPQSDNGGETAGSNIQVTEVDFDGSKFTPNPANIKVGDYIFFKNTGTLDFRPFATADGYQVFDSNDNIAPGGEFKFQFTKVGSWSYYDYSHPNVKGTVIVSP